MIERKEDLRDGVIQRFGRAVGRLRWMGVQICRDCRQILDWREVMHSGGTCPLCGANSGGTVVEHHVVSVLCQSERRYAWLPWPKRWRMVMPPQVRDENGQLRHPKDPEAGA